MPRPPKIRTELRVFRDALSQIEDHIVSQSMLAQRLFTSASYINAIEVGAKPLTRTLAKRILGLYGVFTSPLKPPPDVPFESTPVPFSVRDRSNLVNGILLFLRNPRRTDPHAAYKHYTSRCLKALVEAAAQVRVGPEVLRELRDAIRAIVEEFRLARQYSDALLEQKREWPALPGDAGLKQYVTSLYVTALKHSTPGMGYTADLDETPDKAPEAPKHAARTKPSNSAKRARRKASARPSKLLNHKRRKA